ncbi:molybdenum cofactor guanylyltransferase [Sporosarcina sp. JAI121]|uniref:molybdenum cofactor guanylyltransferase n=1 Tax=Sporosarcina sp. JAI121 TaxID=2723064 RepID=UPI0015C94075|nr:molybdenum cofactor guanylyltransferase [Sporosarcina sp. JAI121]NYF23347.1 molybdopterin-guanine dinucleotide biosynthesis protein A [Sporosarcina sp. JAI121]
MTRTVGIVLAGGQSRRFGSPKAFAKLGEQYFYDRAKDALEASCDEVIVVTRQDLFERFRVGEEVIFDKPEYAGLGPLAGILSVMESVEADRYAVLPCDMPYVDSRAMSKLVEHHEKGVTAVVSDGRYHPLVSIWDQQLKRALKKSLESGQLSVMGLLTQSDVVWINGNALTDDEKRMFTNVNTPETLERGCSFGSNYR